MRRKLFFTVAMCCVLLGCGRSEPPKQILAEVNDYQITLDDFEAGFAQSAFGARQDREHARREYLDNLINQKLILQDAQKKNIDKQKDFLKSIEHFWEQSLLTVSLGIKAREIGGTVVVPDLTIRALYDQGVKDGTVTRPYDEVYPQLKRRAAQEMETQLLGRWMDDLRKNAAVKINENLMKTEKRPL